VVTGDTLALHVALGLEKRVVALFGPTSAAEIDLYGLGSKVVAPLDCVCCYNPVCDRSPSCMDSIGAERVYEQVVEQLAIVETSLAESSGLGITMDQLVGEPGR
jgi:heptosyltransferase-2